MLKRLIVIFFTLSTAEKTPQGLRKAFEKLGPTFVKLGQLLSSRPDFISRAYCDELRKLLDQENPLPYDQIDAVLRQNLSKDLVNSFKMIIKTPISSASIGQVHLAQLKDGSRVVVKVRRPGIKQVIEQDTHVLSMLAGILNNFRFFKGIGIKKIVEEFSWWIGKELDFRTEAQRAKTLADNLKDFRAVKIPKMYDEYSSECTLVSEYIKGITVNEILTQMEKEHVTDPQKLSLPFPINFQKVIGVMLESYVFKQILTDGFFHGDPHPANLILLPQDRVALVDFGIMGILDKREHGQVLMTILSIIEDDPKMLLQVFTTIAEKDFTRKEEMDIIDALSVELHKLHGGSLKEANIGELILNIISLGRKYQLHWSPGIVLGMRAVALIEGIGLRLIPNASIVEYIKPYLRKYLASEAIHKLSEEEIYKDILNLMEFSEKLGDLKDLITDKGLRVNVSGDKMADGG